MWIAMKIDINVSWNDNLYIYIAGFNAYDKGGKILLLFREREKERESQTDRQIVERQVGTQSQSETLDFFLSTFALPALILALFFSLDFSFAFPPFFSLHFVVPWLKALISPNQWKTKEKGSKIEKKRRKSLMRWNCQRVAKELVMQFSGQFEIRNSDCFCLSVSSPSECFSVTVCNSVWMPSWLWSLMIDFFLFPIFTVTNRTTLIVPWRWAGAMVKKKRSWL